MTVIDLIHALSARLESAGVSFGHGTTCAFDEAAWLVLWRLGLPLDALDEVAERLLTADEQAAIDGLIEQRISTRRPAAYLTQEAWLQGVSFHVDERVIVPRSFIAELIPELFQPWVADPDAVTNVLELCTGSGCLAIMLADAFPNAQIDAIDLSADALEVAARRSEEHTSELQSH